MRAIRTLCTGDERDRVPMLARCRSISSRLLDANQNALVQNTAQIVIKDASWAYIASSRHGSVVHINGLVHEWTIGPDHGGGRTVYLQRYLIPLRSWQNMLRLTANSLGRVSAGFVQTRVYQYRWVVTETTTWWGTHSASTFR